MFFKRNRSGGGRLDHPSRRKGSKELDEKSSLLNPFQDSDERYMSIHPLGEGNYGIVECCFDAHLNRVAALKSLREVHQDKPEQVRSIIQEARLVSYLDHPGVVAIYDAFVDEGNNFRYVMKMVEGEELEDLLFRTVQQGTLLPISQCLQIFTKLCETLAYVHDKGVAHLDLKPHNIMLGSYGEVYILDWGNARLFDPKRYEKYLETYDQEGRLEDLQETLTNTIVGSPPYMAPEQTQSNREVLGPGADIFATGVILYHMMTGHFPFSMDSLEDYFYELMKEKPVPLHKRRGDIPKRLSQICSRMLFKDTATRYQNFQEILKDLREFAESGYTFEMKVFEPGEVIFEEGQHGDYAFHILDGLVEISAVFDDKKKVLASRGKGNVIGEVAVFTKEPRTATVTAVERTVVKVMTEEEIMVELEKMSPWISHMIYSLSRKFIEVNQQFINNNSLPQK